MYFISINGKNGKKKMFPLKKIIKVAKMITAIKKRKIYIFYIGIEKKFPFFPFA